MDGKNENLQKKIKKNKKKSFHSLSNGFWPRLLKRGGFESWPCQCRELCLLGLVLGFKNGKILKNQKEILLPL
jgi:hypothetical protein